MAERGEVEQGETGREGGEVEKQGECEEESAAAWMAAE